MSIDRPAVATDWTLIDICNYLGSDISSIYAILGEVQKYFNSGITSGNSPTDILTGIYFGDSDEVKKYRIIVVGTDFLIDKNNGTDAVPVWTNVLTLSGAELDHGALSGLGDDDHPHYSLADGTRAFTGVVGGITPTADAHLATKFYVDYEVADATPALLSADSAKLTVTSGSNNITLDPATMPLTTETVLVDGSQAFTGNQSFGGNDITNVGDIGADNITLTDTVTAPTGTYADSLTVSGVPVITNIDLFSAVASGTEVAYFTDAEALSITHSLNSTDVVCQVIEDVSQEVIQPNKMGPTAPSTYYVEFASPTSGKAFLLSLTQRVLGQGNTAYKYTQNPAASTWNIEHNLGSTEPTVVIYDNANLQIQPDEIEASDGDNVTITFNTSTAGRAVVMKVGSAVTLAGGGGGGGGGVTDHGDLTGLADDDHTMYTKADGTRAFSGNQSFGGHNITNVATAGITTGNITTVAATTVGADTGNLTTVNATTVGATTGNITTVAATTVGATTGNITDVNSDAGVFANSLTLGGNAVLTDAITAITASGVDSTTGVLDFVGAGGAEVEISGQTMTIWAAEGGGGGGGLDNVVEDTTPQLGGNLDVNGKLIQNAAGTSTLDMDTGSDITLTSSDDLLLNSGDAISIDANGSIQITTGSTSASSGKSILINSDSSAGVSISSGGSTSLASGKLYLGAANDVEVECGSGASDSINFDGKSSRLAFAWCHFDSAGGSVTLQKSENVTSVTRNSAGKYTVNFTTAAPTADYAWSGSARPVTDGNIVVLTENIGGSGMGTTSLAITVYQNSVATDSDGVSVIIMAQTT